MPTMGFSFWDSSLLSFQAPRVAYHFQDRAESSSYPLPACSPPRDQRLATPACACAQTLIPWLASPSVVCHCRTSLEREPTNGPASQGHMPRAQSIWPLPSVTAPSSRFQMDTPTGYWRRPQPSLETSASASSATPASSAAISASTIWLDSRLPS